MGPLLQPTMDTRWDPTQLLGQSFSLGIELGLQMGHQLGFYRYTICYPKQELHHHMLNCITKIVWDTPESQLDSKWDPKFETVCSTGLNRNCIVTEIGNHQGY